MKDLYAALEVAPFADGEIVAAAYRSLVAGAAMTGERRQEVEQAHRVLSDPLTRSVYDQALRAAAGAPERLPAAESDLAESVKDRAVNLPRRRRSVGAIVALVIALSSIAASVLISSRRGEEREQLRLQREQETQQRVQQADAEARRRDDEAELRRQIDLDTKRRLEQYQNGIRNGQTFDDNAAR